MAQLFSLMTILVRTIARIQDFRIHHQIQQCFEYSEAVKVELVAEAIHQKVIRTQAK